MYREWCFMFCVRRTWDLTSCRKFVESYDPTLGMLAFTVRFLTDTKRTATENKSAWTDRKLCWVCVVFVRSLFLHTNHCLIGSSDIFDTAGQEDFSGRWSIHQRLRRRQTARLFSPLCSHRFVAVRDSYMNTGDGFIIMYSIVDLKSFNEVQAIYTKLEMIQEGAKVPGNRAYLCSLNHHRSYCRQQVRLRRRQTSYTGSRKSDSVTI